MVCRDLQWKYLRTCIENMVAYFLPNACKINYVHMRLRYGDIQHINFDMQIFYANVWLLTCNIENLKKMIIHVPGISKLSEVTIILR